MGKSESHARLDLQITFKFVMVLAEKFEPLNIFLARIQEKFLWSENQNFGDQRSRTEQFSEKKIFTTSGLRNLTAGLLCECHHFCWFNTGWLKHTNCYVIRGFLYWQNYELATSQIFNYVKNAIAAKFYNHQILLQPVITWSKATLTNVEQSSSNRLQALVMFPGFIFTDAQNVIEA